MILRAIKKTLGHGRRRSQPLFEKMYSFAVHGMNVGMAQCATSGELEVLRYLHKRLANKPRPLVLFDAGANVGEYTLSMRRRFGEEAVIHSFEPSQPTFEILSKHTAGLKNIHCHQFGLGQEETSLDLFYDVPGSSIASFYSQRPDHDIKTNLHEKVHIRTIDSFCAENGIQRVDFLKIDVEGFELQVLQGAKGMIERDAISAIQFEFGPKHVDSRTFFRDFHQLLNPKYRISRVVEDGLFPIKIYSEYHELFCAPINYFAQHR